MDFCSFCPAFFFLLIFGDVSDFADHEQHLHLGGDSKSKKMRYVNIYLNMKIIIIPDCFLGQVTPETVRPPLCLPELRCPRTQSSQRTRDSEEEAVDGRPRG